MIRDILSFAALRVTTIFLYDIDATRNVRIASPYAAKIIQRLSLPTVLTYTTDQR